MTTYLIHTQYPNPARPDGAWETIARTVGKAVNNVRAQIRRSLGVPFVRIVTDYWTVTAAN